MRLTVVASHCPRKAENQSSAATAIDRWVARIEDDMVKDNRLLIFECRTSR